MLPSLRLLQRRLFPLCKADLKKKSLPIQAIATDIVKNPTNANEPSKSAISALTSRVRASIISSFGPDVDFKGNQLVILSKSDYGDYQCAVAMSLAKSLKLDPREVAKILVHNLQVEDIVLDVNISGAGFINMKLSPSYIQHRISQIIADTSGRLGVGTLSPLNKQRVIVDYSSPNIAKDMHVGHLRSTIIGDTISRILDFLGHDVVRLNHIGDWGTQFGMLISYLRDHYKASTPANSVSSCADLNMSVSELASCYREAKKLFDTDSTFQDAARREVVQLQSKNPESLKMWSEICEISRREYKSIYSVLGIQGLQERGESFYNPMLQDVVDSLISKSLAVQNDGAWCVFLSGFYNIDGTPQPLILKKADGGYLYATTDLAAVKHRVQREHADRILYVTDSGQMHHFKMIFKAAQIAGFLIKPGDDKSTVELKHVPFGVVQGTDGKKFQTRAGESVKLRLLLDEAVAKAKIMISDNLTLSEEQKIHAAKVLGIGAVKYADLSMNRESNYKFSFDKMLSMTGNTAPYMLYVYARIRGIHRKAASNTGNLDEHESSNMNESDKSVSVILETPEEIALAKQILLFQEVLADVEKDLYPNKLCEYIFDLSQKFNQFYEKCPVLGAHSLELIKSRTILCQVTADTLSVSLRLLGIDTLEQL